MKKVSIIYWSNGGNVEIIANAICEGASIGDVEVETKHVADASTEDVLEADAVAFGSPAMINDDIEEIDMKPFIGAFVTGFGDWLMANEKEAKSIADKAINARKAREAAKKARDNVRNKDHKKQNALKFDSKLADCYSKDRKKCELFITEGKR